MRAQLSAHEQANRTLTRELADSRRRAAYLRAASAAQAAWLEYERMLSQLARLSVEHMTDFRVISLCDEHDASVPAVVLTKDETLQESATSMWREFEAHDALSGLAVLRHGCTLDRHREAPLQAYAAANCVT